jgi:hypothetical protein
MLSVLCDMVFLPWMEVARFFRAFLQASVPGPRRATVSHVQYQPGWVTVPKPCAIAQVGQAALRQSAPDHPDDGHRDAGDAVSSALKPACRKS